MKKIVPEFMLKAACEATCNKHNVTMETGLEAALLALSENPIVPSYKQMDAIRAGLNSSGYDQFLSVVKGWQEIMFLAPEPEVPEELKEIWDEGWSAFMKEHTLSVFRRGQNSVK